MLNLYIKESAQPAKGCIIWMHGLGADAADMAGLAEQSVLAQLPLEHVFIEAPVRAITINGGMSMRAWYDIVSVDLHAREDRESIIQSQQQILAVINQQITKGFLANQIYLAGFSQGGAMALYTALHMTTSLAGVICLSGYLPLREQCLPTLLVDTPLFIGYGQYDPVVWPIWTQATINYLEEQHYKTISSHVYQMAHSICNEEINDLANWINRHIEKEV